MMVLSLFDGIACAYQALQQCGIPVDGYYASEIDKAAMRVACHNHPDIIEIGDVKRVSYSNGWLFTEKGMYDVGRIDLLCGGSPCTNFSSIGNANGMVAAGQAILSLEQYLTLKENNIRCEGESYLFWEYVRLLKEIQPTYFLLENVRMAQHWKDIISDTLGVKPLYINSSLLSAQNRPRLYWTNIPGVTIPIDKRIVLDDILDARADCTDVSKYNTVQRNLPRLIEKYGLIPCRFNAFNASRITDKACTLSRGSMVTSSCATLLFVSSENGSHTVANGFLDDCYPTELEDGRYALRKLSSVEMERLQTLPDGYTAIDGIGYQTRSRMLGNGWTVSVIAHIFSFIR